MESLYSNYSQEVQEYMSNVLQCLKEDYGEIPASWRISLDLIADNVDIYLKANDDIDKNGLLRVDKAGRTFKNQNVSIMNVAQRNLTDLLKSFALTPMSKSKMKMLKASGETVEEYLDNLTD